MTIEEKDLINWRQVSIHLTGKPENIRSSYVGKKYHDKIQGLKMLIKIWMRNSKS